MKTKEFIDEVSDVLGDMYEILDSLHKVNALPYATNVETSVSPEVTKMFALTNQVISMVKVLNEENNFLRSRLAYVYNHHTDIDIKMK